MKIAVISDTHIPQNADKLPEEIFKIFKGVDLIIHAGDLVSMEVISALSKIAEVKAVSGNMDTAEVIKKLPQKEIIKIANFKIGVVHGYGPPDNLLDLVAKQFSPLPDVIVFGHSHAAFNEKRKNTLFFNPGSPTDKIFAPYNSCGILEIGNTIEGKIIKLHNNNAPR